MDDSLRKDLFESLKHTRLIHFTLVVVSATLAYVVASIWSDAPDVLRDLIRLRDLGRSLSVDSRGGVSALQSEAWSRDRAESLLEVIEQGLGTKVERDLLGDVFDRMRTYDRAELQRGAAGRFARAESASLHELRTMLEQPLVVRKVETARIDSESLEWARQHSRGPTIDGLSVSGSYLELGALTPLADDGDGVLVANLELRATSFTTMTDTQTGLGHTSTFPEGERVVTVSFDTVEESIPLPPTWLRDRHPRLWSRWSEHETKTVEGAIASLQAEIGESLDTHEPKLLGIAVHGRHVAVVGPIAIGIVLLYLWTYLGHMAGVLRRPAVGAQVQSCDFVPWIGAMPGRWPATFMVLSLVVLPTASVALALTRVLPVGWFVDALSIALIALLGTLCAVQSRRIVQGCHPGPQ